MGLAKDLKRAAAAEASHDEDTDLFDIGKANKPVPKFLKDRVSMSKSFENPPDLLAPLKDFTKTHVLTDSSGDKAILSQMGFSTEGSIKSAGLLQTQLHSQSIHFAQTYATAANTSVIKGENELWDFWRIGSLLESICDRFEKMEEPAPLPEKVVKPVEAILRLNETPVIFLFERPSLTAEKESDEGKQVEEDIVRYDYLTIGKGRNRKTTNAEVQTAISLYKTRSTFSERRHTRDNYAFASQWDMFDTFENLLPNVQDKAESHKLELTQEEKDRQMKELTKSNSFQNSLVIMERILDNNIFKKQQKRFRGLIQQDPFRPDIHFKYTLDQLWTFKNTTAAYHPVTCMSWNPFNSDIIAVGYGKFFYEQKKDGFIFCWNMKNPTQPEREYYYSDPVTAVAFSNYKPTLIGVGCYNGSVTILDITCKVVKLLYHIAPKCVISREPIWQLMWQPPDEYSASSEYLVYACEDGYVCRLMIEETNELTPYKIMKPVMVETMVQGIHQQPICRSDDVPTTVSPAVLCLTKHPVDKDLYMIGTDNGAIHKCSRNNITEPVDVFLAHSGPVYCCQFSPICNSFFLTAGADWCINIWVEGIKQPLITLTSPMQYVECAVWSPTNGTIIASVGGNTVHVWDIQRKTYSPSSTFYSPDNCRNTTIQFTSSGRNLVVGDVNGNVRVYSLEDMPFPQFYPAEILTEVVRNALLTRRDLLKELENKVYCKKRVPFNL